MNELARYAKGYAIGYTNAESSGQYAIGLMYIPTASERAQCIDFRGDAEGEAGWLAGWTEAIEPFRAFQSRELGITTAMEWTQRKWRNHGIT